jgi:hypothetical protein
MSFRIRLLAAASLALALAGCGLWSGARPAGPPAPASPTEATLVLYRVHLGPGRDDDVDHAVALDGAPVGRLEPDRELRLTLPAGLHTLSVRPEAGWFGTPRQDALNYGLELAPGSTRYLRYRTATGAGRLAPQGGAVLADRALDSVSELEYAARR